MDKIQKKFGIEFFLSVSSKILTAVAMKNTDLSLNT
jgi:hypothetical protein